MSIEASKEKSVITYFAPAERLSLEQVQESRRRLLETWPAEQLLECFPGPVVVLNRLRQIVLANEQPDQKRSRGYPAR